MCLISIIYFLSYFIRTVERALVMAIPAKAVGRPSELSAFRFPRFSSEFADFCSETKLIKALMRYSGHYLASRIPCARSRVKLAALGTCVNCREYDCYNYFSNFVVPNESRDDGDPSSSTGRTRCRFLEVPLRSRHRSTRGMPRKPRDAEDTSRYDKYHS